MFPFQSPSLRGSGRFKSFRRCRVTVVYRFNPLHCGAVVASARQEAEERAPLLVSIPFIAGQWSLREARDSRAGSRSTFQSPSLRGSGRFSPPTHAQALNQRFQSPSLRGSGRFLKRV